MASRCMSGTPLFLPFLYPCHPGFCRRIQRAATAAARPVTKATPLPPCPRLYSSQPAPPEAGEAETSVEDAYQESHLNPAPHDYNETSFADKATLTLYGGGGGNGCIAFLRDLFVPDGPPNGGDGGHGGSVYIQAVPGETSLHKIARQRVMRAGRGKHGEGTARNGLSGEDLVLRVPVGTVVTEISRVDPVVDEIELARARFYAAKRKKKREAAAEAAIAEQAAEAERKQAEEEAGLSEEELLQLQWQRKKKAKKEEAEPGADGGAYRTEAQLKQERLQKEADEADEAAEQAWLRRKWVVYPGLASSEVQNIVFPRLPRRDRPVVQPPAPIRLDLSRPTPQPILLAAGGIGGLGNPHFASRLTPRPVVATKGERAVSLTIALELKLLADVGLVGLPNAGKSTLLRAVSNSRARVGAWAFTTLQPNIGTVVLDNNRGRPRVSPRTVRGATNAYDGRGSGASSEAATTASYPAPPRTRFTMADIPGLIEGAHLDKGLGMEFLRHVERAGVLAFVVDLGAGDAVAALKALWKEVGLYARLRDEEEQRRELDARIEWDDAAGEGAQPASRVLADRASFTSAREHRLFAADRPDHDAAAPSPELAIAGKPWFVVATKADLPGTEANFEALRAYLDRIGRGDEAHPSGVAGGWTAKLAAIPISAIHGQGIEHVVHWTVGLLEM